MSESHSTENTNPIEGILEDERVQQGIQTTRSFYERNRPAILLVATTVVLYKIEKRMVKKVVTKALKSEFDLAQIAYNKATAEIDASLMNAFLEGFDHAIGLVDDMVGGADKIKAVNIQDLLPRAFPRKR